MRSDPLVYKQMATYFSWSELNTSFSKQTNSAALVCVRGVDEFPCMRFV
jgi:hypothetical protein